VTIAPGPEFLDAPALPWFTVPSCPSVSTELLTLAAMPVVRSRSPRRTIASDALAVWSG
jgi:hypothetical protein